MKSVFIAILLLFSSASFASDVLNCRVVKANTPVDIKVLATDTLACIPTDLNEVELCAQNGEFKDYFIVTLETEDKVVGEFAFQKVPGQKTLKMISKDVRYSGYPTLVGCSVK
jgi:hypothetical protein